MLDSKADELKAEQSSYRSPMVIEALLRTSDIASIWICSNG